MPSEPTAANVRAYLDLDGTLVGGNPYWRLSVKLPQWFGFWVARHRKVIA